MPSNIKLDEKQVRTDDMLSPSEKKFIRLRDEWKTQRRHESSTTKMVMQPAFLTIIGMGPAAIPYLLRELEHDPDIWYWALRAITEANPVDPEMHGDPRGMAQAWLQWGRDQGYQW